MTCQDKLICLHEPFGDAFYWGPERRSPRSENEDNAREGAGFEDCTYKVVVERILKAAKNKRVFIKDFAFHILPPPGHAASFAPSLMSSNDPSTEPDNPSIIPTRILEEFQFAFLIRHPRRCIPSLYRCCVPPLSFSTGWDSFLPSEDGYAELHKLFDFVRVQCTAEIEGPRSAADRGVCLIDADDLLDNPTGILKKFCHLNNLEYSDEMLSWETAEQQQLARKKFQKWKGFHEDVLESTGLKARDRKWPQRIMTEEEEDEDWRRRYGDEGARIIRETVNASIPHYEYLKQFALKA